MMNNRGQAFSVFQLLIAAIVAVAILGVLFGVMGGIDVGVSGNPKTEIGNALSAVKNGGQTQTQTFQMKKNDLITSQDFEEKGFDTASVLFALEDFENDDEATGFSVGTEGDKEDGGFSFVRYMGNTPRNVTASVLCQATGTRLGNTLAVSGFENVDDGTFDDLCADGDDDIQPCCAVIIKRG